VVAETHHEDIDISGPEEVAVEINADNFEQFGQVYRYTFFTSLPFHMIFEGCIVAIRWKRFLNRRTQPLF